MMIKLIIKYFWIHITKKMKKLLFISFFLIQSVVFGQDLKLKFNHFAVLVQDLETSVNFYQDILLLDEITDQTGLDHIRWFSMGNSELHIIQDKNKITHHQGVHFALEVNNLDAFREHLKGKNIDYINWFGKQNTTNNRPDGVRQIYLQDPDGYWIEINGK